MIGIIILIFGIIIRSFAIIQLKHNFSTKIKYPKYLVKTGIYNIIRHPMYLGSIIMFIGITIINIKLSIILLSISLIQYRIQEEEKYMDCIKGYKEYRLQTGGLLPKLWRKNGK